MEIQLYVYRYIYIYIYSHAVYFKAMTRGLLRRPLVIFAGVQTFQKSAQCLCKHIYIYIFTYIHVFTCI